MKFKVEKKHIVAGKDCQLSRLDCPVAMAVNEQLVDGYFALVSENSIEIRQITSENEYVLGRWNSKELKRRIVEFDQRWNVEPFEFELDVPERYVREPRNKFDSSAWVDKFLKSLVSSQECTFELDKNQTGRK